MVCSPVALLDLTLGSCSVEYHYNVLVKIHRCFNTSKYYYIFVKEAKTSNF